MKINAINNTNFKGLFVNKTSENNGNWRMEYYPYSWEQWGNGADYYSKYFGMAYQKDVDILASDLPDNEKIYTDATSGYYSKTGREYCKDILGTEFYYADYSKNVARKQITKMPAMTLEDSLRIKIKKLARFLAMKKDAKVAKEASLLEYKSKINDANNSYSSSSTDYDRGYWDRIDDKSTNKNQMDNAHGKVKEFIDKTFSEIEEYTKLSNSEVAVIDLRQKLTEEVDKLTQAREEGNLIDISRRDIYDPNKTLWESIQEMIRTRTLETSKKLVALPHRSISMQEIVRTLGDKIKGSDASGEIIKLVDKLIETKK